ncbi:MAG: dioxygenase family protein [Armatimonadota bacterium]
MRGTRRFLLWSGIVLVAAVVLWPTGGASAQRQVTPPAPACTPTAAVTPSQTEGPFYKANTPQRTSLVEQGMAGTRLIVTGYVLGRDCRAVPRAWLDFWQADARGEYDNTGFRLRGHQFTDTAGIYYLETVMPGQYPGRTPHIHVKVRAANGPILTSQLYFPGEARNQGDGIFNQRLVVSMQDGAGGKVAFFNFIIETR